MPWPLGTAELQLRLKKALGIRGAIPLELDETIVPTVAVETFSIGSRGEPLLWVFNDRQAAVAAQSSFLVLFMESTDTGMVLVERVDAMLTAAAGAATGIQLQIARTADVPAGTDGLVRLAEPVIYDGTVPRVWLPRTRRFAQAAGVTNAVRVARAILKTGDFKDPTGDGWQRAALPLLLTPGHALVATTEAVNVEFEVTARGVTWLRGFDGP